MVLNPNENFQEVEIPARSPPLPSPGELPDEPAEKRERRDDKESKKKREFYEKYRNPQKEMETERIPIRVSLAGRERDGCQRRGARRSRSNRSIDVAQKEIQRGRTREVGIRAKFERDKRGTAARTMGGG